MLIVTVIDLSLYQIKMLVFNKKFYDESCYSSGSIFSRLDAKPGKHEYESGVLGLPQSFRVEDSDVDEKRVGPVRLKSPEEILNRRQRR